MWGSTKSTTKYINLTKVQFLMIGRFLSKYIKFRYLQWSGNTKLWTFSVLLIVFPADPSVVLKYSKLKSTLALVELYLISAVLMSR